MSKNESIKLSSSELPTQNELLPKDFQKQLMERLLRIHTSIQEFRKSGDELNESLKAYEVANSPIVAGNKEVQRDKTMQEFRVTRDAEISKSQRAARMEKLQKLNNSWESKGYSPNSQEKPNNVVSADFGRKRFDEDIAA